MREYTSMISIDAPVESVWQQLTDVRSWPEWTHTVESAEPLDQGPLALGTRVRIRQPKLRPATWTVTSWQPGREFTWTSRGPGVRVTAMHRVEPAANGCSVQQSLRFDGALASLVTRALGPLVSDYMKHEVDGLKRHCERKQRRQTGPALMRTAYC